MRNYIIRRLFIVLISLIGVSMIIFLSVRLIPGDIVQVMLAQQGMGQEQIEQMRITFGLDRPLYIQYLIGFWASCEEISAIHCAQVARFYLTFSCVLQ